MAARATTQKSKRAAKPKSPPEDLGAAVERLEGKVRALQDERDKLREELDEARRTIATLEASQTDAVNRIDWVIDSLHTLIEEKS